MAGTNDLGACRLVGEFDSYRGSIVLVVEAAYPKQEHSSDTCKNQKVQSYELFNEANRPDPAKCPYW